MISKHTLLRLAEQHERTAKVLRKLVEMQSRSDELCNHLHSIPLDTPVNDLNLSVRAMKTLQRAEISVLSELLEKSPADLLAVKNCGFTTVREIEAVLQKHGLSLAAEDMPAAPHRRRHQPHNHAAGFGPSSPSIHGSLSRGLSLGAMVRSTYTSRIVGSRHPMIFTLSPPNNSIIVATDFLKM